MTRSITLKQLQRAGACDYYVRRFRELFGPNGRVAVTVDNAQSLAPTFRD
jgi:hypothetical protein